MENNDKQSEKLEKLNQRIAENPDDANLFRERADMNLENGKLLECLKDINKAIELDPQNADFYNLRGSLNYASYKISTEKEEGKPLTNYLLNSAIDDYKKALEQKPDDEEVIFELLQIYLEIKDYDKIYKYLKNINLFSIDDIGEENFKILIEIIEFFEKNGDYDKAIDLYDRINPFDYGDIRGESLADNQIIILKLYKEKAQKEIEHERALNQAKIEERNRIIRNQAHDIKNIISTIIDPLMYLQRKYHNPQIDQAIKQAEVIGKMVNATSLSYSGSPQDFFYDAHNNEEGIGLKEMIITSVEASVGNIVEGGQYYSFFWEKYFPEDSVYEKALSEYRDLWGKNPDERFEYLINFIEKYMCKFNVDFGKSDTYFLGNKKSSDVKMLALFNEIIFNAIKYASIVDKKERFVSIEFMNDDKRINLKVENSYNKKANVKTTGTGNLIIENMLKVMGGNKKINKQKANNHYIIEIIFDNYWKGEKNE